MGLMRGVLLGPGQWKRPISKFGPSGEKSRALVRFGLSAPTPCIRPRTVQIALPIPCRSPFGIFSESVTLKGGVGSKGPMGSKGASTQLRVKGKGAPNGQMPN
jgi:hypothetical protein